MKIRFNQSKKRNLQHGQGMVEFALAFPIFLVLVIGIMEFGRLLVTYSSVYVAAREGARHGAAVENLPACGGDIESEAERVGVLAGDMTVFVSYDSGPGTATKACGNQGANLVLGDRVNVTATTSFTPVTGIVPGFTVSSTASRTIIKKAYVGVAEGAPEETEATEESSEEPTEEETEEPPEEPTEEVTLTPTPGPCPATVMYPASTKGDIVTMALTNNSGATFTLKSLFIDWDVNGNRYLEGITIKNPAGQIVQTWTSAPPISNKPYTWEASPPLDITSGVWTIEIEIDKFNKGMNEVMADMDLPDSSGCYVQWLPN